jgi:predicted amidophosphoribosyltransferase
MLQVTRVVVFVPTAFFGLMFLLGCRWMWNRIIEERWTARESRGCCGRCGYDLRFGQDLCPECAFPINQSVLNHAHKL